MDALVLGGLLLVAGYGLAKSLTACKPLVYPGARFFLLGDSLGVGMDRYFRKLCAQKGVAYDSAVKGGMAAFNYVNPSYGLANRLSSFKPSVVAISLGTNDSKGNLSPEQHKVAIKALLGMVGSVGAEPYWVLPPKLPWQQTYSDLVRAEKVRVFESSQVDIPMGPDKVHPTGLGYAGWAGMVWGAMNCGEKSAEPLVGFGAVPVMPPPKARFLKPVKPAGVLGRPRRLG